MEIRVDNILYVSPPTDLGIRRIIADISYYGVREYKKEMVITERDYATILQLGHFFTHYA